MQPECGLTVEDRVSRTLRNISILLRTQTPWSFRNGRSLVAKLKTLPQLRDIASDQQDKRLEAGRGAIRSRHRRAALGFLPQLIDNVLYDAFGQRQVSTMYTALNQYHVVMEVAPRFWQDPEFLKQIYVYDPRAVRCRSTPSVITRLRWLRWR